MKYHKLILAILAVMLVACVVVLAQERSWFDMKNCEFCKPWSTPEMLKNTTHEQYGIANGAMMITNFNPNFRDAYKKASAEMGVLSQRAAKGEKVYMCGSCETMGSFFMRGAQVQELMVNNGAIMLMTSSDTSLVNDIHNWVQKNIEEEKKLKAAEKK